MNALETTFHDLVHALAQASQAADHIGPDNVYQRANPRSQTIVHQMMERLMLPSSRVVNFTALSQLQELSRQGKSCLILPEHYSNFDLPNLIFLLGAQGEEGRELADRIISMAGYKLNEESDFVRSFSEAYSRLVSCPPRTLESLLRDPEGQAAEIARAKAINLAVIARMTRLKREGHILLVYPTGTRYRPGDESTRRCLREMDSYLKSFDHFVLVGMAGNTLRIHPRAQEMAHDEPCRDKIVFVVSEVLDGQAFRAKVTEGVTTEDRRQVVADALSHELAELHARALAEYEQDPPETP